MDLFEAQDFFRKLNPGKKVDFEFDQNCHRTIELVFNDGMPNMTHHVEHRKAKMLIDGSNPQYIPIKSHRMPITWSQALQYLNSIKQVKIDDSSLEFIYKTMASEPDKDMVKAQQEVTNKVKEISQMTGMSDTDIMEQVKNYGLSRKF